MEDNNLEMSKISEEDLDFVAGGTQKEYDQLLGICNGDEALLDEALKANHISALMYTGGTSVNNHYITTVGNETVFLGHDKVVALVSAYVISHSL